MSQNRILKKGPSGNLACTGEGVLIEQMYDTLMTGRVVLKANQLIIQPARINSDAHRQAGGGCP